MKPSGYGPYARSTAYSTGADGRGKGLGGGKAPGGSRARARVVRFQGMHVLLVPWHVSRFGRYYRLLWRMGPAPFWSLQ